MPVIDMLKHDRARQHCEVGVARGLGPACSYVWTGFGTCFFLSKVIRPYATTQQCAGKFSSLTVGSVGEEFVCIMDGTLLSHVTVKRFNHFTVDF